MLGGSAEDKLKVHKVFDVGCLRTVMLVDRDPQDRVGYDIISAGKLRHLRTIQCSVLYLHFYVVDTDNYIVIGCVIGSDTIFYLTDKNFAHGYASSSEATSIC
jgi:hypothetical protein